MRATIAAVATLALAACGEAAEREVDGTGAHVEIDTAATGTIIVRNRGPAPEWQRVEILSLGSSGATGGAPRPDEFGYVTGVVGDSAGRVYVADAQAAEIRVFDESGGLVRRIGRRGAGPGEFLAPVALGWLGDRLAVLDVGAARLGLLSAEGQWLGHEAYRGGDGGRLLPAGTDDLYMPNLRMGADGLQPAYVRLSPAGTSDTLVTPATMVDDLPAARCTYRGGTIHGVRRAAFAPRRIQEPAPGLLRAEVATADYRIVFTTAAGDTVRIVERDLPRRPVTDAAWDEATAQFEAFLEAEPDATCDRRTLPRPDAMEMIQLVFFDRSGRMWVERRTDTGFVLDAFDADGRLLGEVAIPERFERVSPYVRGDRLHLVTRDDLGVHYVQVFRIVGAG